MTLALGHAIFSAVLNTEAAANLMSLPASGKLSLLKTPHSLPAQLLQAQENFKSRHLQHSPILAQPGNCSPSTYLEPKIIAVWKTTAGAHLNNQNTSWLQGLARDIPDAKRFVKNARNNPILNARRAVMPE
eukprot:1156093-Pelagomonas_calceolata.AAC.4